jgi:hypothetical protein
MTKHKSPSISMTDLTGIIHRKAGTVRKWEATGFLPEHLIPHRDYRNHRYWEHEQVHGKGGILDWMVDNDMRPGRLMADPKSEDRHIESLRKPKYISGDLVRGVRLMVDNGRSYDYIIDKTFPRTRYATKSGFERSLVGYFRRMGWEFPRKQRQPYPPPRLRLGKPGPKRKRARRRAGR